mmetsp:Transcript_4531/g.7696  ORF Transcript_4531/g.7696 Transcript_4531/m.7696 type:complete len:212 (-) Transcript_4531:460-1095(-)
MPLWAMSTSCPASCIPTSTSTLAWCTAPWASHLSSSPCCSLSHASWATVHTGVSRWPTRTPRSCAHNRTTGACGCAISSLSSSASLPLETRRIPWFLFPPQMPTIAVWLARTGSRGFRFDPLSSCTIAEWWIVWKGQRSSGWERDWTFGVAYCFYFINLGESTLMRGCSDVCTMCDYVLVSLWLSFPVEFHFGQGREAQGSVLPLCASACM